MWRRLADLQPAPHHAAPTHIIHLGYTLCSVIQVRDFGSISDPCRQPPTPPLGFLAPIICTAFWPDPVLTWPTNLDRLPTRCICTFDPSRFCIYCGVTLYRAFALRATHIYSSTPAKPNPEFWIPRKLGHIDTNPLVANQFLKRRKQEKKRSQSKKKNKTLWRILPSDHLAADSTARVRPPNAPEPTENRYLAKPVYFTAIFVLLQRSSATQSSTTNQVLHQHAVRHCRCRPRSPTPR